MKSYTVIASITLALLSLSSSSIAQTDSTLVPYKKNEIGIAVGPVLLVAMGAQPYSQPIGLAYNRVFGKEAFRVKYLYRNDEPVYDEETIVRTDSTRVSGVFNKVNNHHIVRVGLEKRRAFPSGIMLVSGFDISGRLFSEQSYNTNFTFRLDSTGSDVYPFTDHVWIRTEDRLETQIGLGISAGLMVPLAKRWLLSGHLRMDTYYGPSETTVTDHLSDEITKSTSNNFDFQFGPLLSEVILSYRF